jgi:hypothetical protein
MRHLVRRALTSISDAGPGPEGESTARSVLNDREMFLWSEMDGRDRSHSLIVLARFDALMPGAVQQERAAALLHDVGKNASRLGWFMRVVATIVGPRGRNFAAYHNHETIGARMLQGVSEPRTVELVGGVAKDPVADLLRRADEV